MKRLSKLFGPGTKEKDKQSSGGSVQPDSSVSKAPPSPSSRSITAAKPPAILMQAVPTIQVESSGASKSSQVTSPKAAAAHPSAAPTASSRRKSTPAELDMMLRMQAAANGKSIEELITNPDAKKMAFSNYMVTNAPAAPRAPLAARQDSSAASPSAHASSVIQVTPSANTTSPTGTLKAESSQRIEDDANHPGRKNKILSLSPNIPINMARKFWSLSEFKVMRKMYTGYASTVYHAVDKKSREQVALKVYHMENLCELNHFQVYREIKLHSSLDHQNIIHLICSFQEGRDVVLVQEYAEGGDLYRLLHKAGGRLSERQAVEMVLHPFLLSLNYLHTRGIMHRDIKPENVLFTDQKVLKLADFGLAIDLNEERAVTRAGTLDYMAPEVLKCPPKNRPQENKEKSNLYYNNSVDAWAVGVFAYELIVGFPPFAGDTQTDSVNNIMHQAAPEFPEKMSELAKLFITQALKKHPGDRPTVMEMLHHPWIRSYQRRASTLTMPVSGQRRVSSHIPEIPPFKGAGGGGVPAVSVNEAAAKMGANMRAPEPSPEDMTPDQIEDMIKKLQAAKVAKERQSPGP